MLNLITKQRSKLLVTIATSAIMLTGTNVIQADDDTGWFVGAGLARLDANFDSPTDANFDDSDDTWQLKFGYMFTDIVGIEGGYVDLGNYQGSRGGEIDADGYSIAGVLNWSVADRWDIYGKLGAAMIEAKSDQFIPGVGLVREDDDETNVFGGVGVEYDLGTLNFYFEWARMDTDVADLKVDAIALGIKAEF